MDTPYSVAGRMLEFMAQTLLGRRIELGMDQRRRACEVFSRLYFCVSELEALTHRLLKAARQDIESGRALMLFNQLNIDERLINSNSEIFIDIVSGQLYPVLEMYDPELALTLCELCSWKFGFLLAGSAGVVVIREGAGGVRFGRLKFRRPSDRMLALDIEKHYRWVKEHPDPQAWPENLEWPQSFLAAGRFREDLEEGEFDLDDLGCIREVVELLEPHAGSLGRARAALREFIRSHFTIDEVLYVSHGLMEH